jgi:hypothetical protein
MQDDEDSRRESAGSLDTNVRSVMTPPAEAATATTVTGGGAVG